LSKDDEQQLLKSNVHRHEIVMLLERAI